MSHWVRMITLLVLAAATVPIAPTTESHQLETESPPGVTVETIGRGPGQSAGEDLVLLRITLTPDAYLSPVAQTGRTLLTVETGGAALWLLVGHAEVTRQGAAAPDQVKAFELVTLNAG